MSKLETYKLISQSLIIGIAKIFRSKISLNTLYISYNKYLKLKEHPVEGSLVKELFDELDKLSLQEIDDFSYLTNASLLVYATTVFDTFLTETTKFLFLNNPNSVGEGVKIDYEDILKAESKSKLISSIIDKKTREISFQSFIERIKFITQLSQHEIGR